LTAAIEMSVCRRWSTNISSRAHAHI